MLHKKRLLILCVCLLVFAGGGIYWFLTKPVRLLIPTTNLSLLAPSGYKTSLRFPGIEDTSTNGSFTVNRFPVQAIGSLGEMFASKERAEPTLNNRGIQVEGVEEITWQDKKVLVFRGTQKNEEDVLYEKWIAVFIAERPIMIAFQEPRPGKLSTQEILQVFSSLGVKSETF